MTKVLKFVNYFHDRKSPEIVEIGLDAISKPTQFPLPNGTASLEKAIKMNTEISGYCAQSGAKKLADYHRHRADACQAKLDGGGVA